MNRSLSLGILFVCVCLSACVGYKILVVYPFPAKSHNILGNGVVKHLLRAGHKVTYITSFPMKDQTSPNLRQIDIHEVISSFSADVVNIKALMHKEVELNDDNSLFHAIFQPATAAVKHKNVQNLINDPMEKFDVVVAEWMFNEIYSGFAAVFDCPYMWVVPYEPYINVLSLIDEGPNPAYVPSLVSSSIPSLSFIQRAQELWSQLQSTVLKTYFHLPLEKAVYEEVFGPAAAKRGRALPPYEELRHNVSMILGGSHVSTGLPIHLPPSFKSIAGYYIDDPVKPLPEDLQKLMENSAHGVIYFSMGSNLKSNDLPDVIKRDLIKMFGERKEDIIWKFEENLQNLPKNVHIVQWAPQQSILAHRNCKLFITHGGLLSTTEAAHFGVPIIGIPVFVDQFSNVGRAVAKGSAKRVDISYALADDLRLAIEEIISNPMYMQRAKEVSLVYHDRPVSGGAELVHWVEHVIRTSGAPLLRSPALLLPWYQKLYLDLLGVVLLLIISLTIIFKKLLSLSVTKKKTSVRKKKN